MKIIDFDRKYLVKSIYLYFIPDEAEQTRDELNRLLEANKYFYAFKKNGCEKFLAV